MNRYCRKPRAWTMVLAAVAVAFMAREPVQSFLTTATESTPQEKAAEPKQEETVMPPVPPQGPSVDEVRRRARDHVLGRLEKAERLIDEAVQRELAKVDQFFRRAKTGTRTFVEEALSWGSKRRLVWDAVRFWSDDNSHERFLKDKFEDIVFRGSDLEALISQISKQLSSDISAIENQLLVDIRSDLADLPLQLELSQMSNDQLGLALRQRMLQRARDAANTGLAVDVAQEAVVAGIVWAVMTQVATKLGVSGAILGTGAGSSWATFGIGIIVAVIVDQIVSWVWDWVADPKGKLATELDSKLDDIRRLIVDGDESFEGLRKNLSHYVRSRNSLRRQALLELVQNSEFVQ